MNDEGFDRTLLWLSDGRRRTTALLPIGETLERPFGHCRRRNHRLHQSAASRMLSKTSSGSPPPFLFTMQALLLALT